MAGGFAWRSRGPWGAMRLTGWGEQGGWGRGVDAQGCQLGWKDGTESVQRQSEAERGWWGEDGCRDDRAGVCEPEPAEDGGEDGVSVGVVCGADYLQDGLRRLQGGVWGEWVRHPFEAMPEVPGGSGRRGSAGGSARAIRLLRVGRATARTARCFAWHGWVCAE